jgi:hypothetical protein
VNKLVVVVLVDAWALLRYDEEEIEDMPRSIS